MIDKTRRKELVREYRERKQIRGIYAIHCEAAGKIWVAASPNLDHRQSSLWFQLRNDGQPNKSMSAAWMQHGEASFRFEILEEVSDENPLLIGLLLKERAAYWLRELRAESVIG